MSRQTGLTVAAGAGKAGPLAVWREGINAHLTAAIALAERSPAGLMMPNQSLLYAGKGRRHVS
jgi:4-hydroxyphenylacetate 3-monooxygenase